MIFGNNQDTENILKVLEQIESYLKEDTNKIEIDKNKCSGKNQIIMEKILNLAQIIQNKQNDDLTIYGEIMLCTEKLSDGYTEDRITKQTSNNKLNYIAKSINSMSEKLQTSLIKIDNILEEYSKQNFLSTIDADLFRGGELKKTNHWNKLFKK